MQPTIFIQAISSLRSSPLPLVTTLMLLQGQPLLAATAEDCTLLANPQVSAFCQQLIAGDEVSNRNTVAVIQQGLNDLGFSVGIVDGMAGEKTFQALQGFYQKSELSPRTEYSANTLVDIVDQLKLLKTAQSLVEQSLLALNAKDFTRATSQLDTASRLSRLLAEPDGLRLDIAAGIEAENLARQLQVTESADTTEPNQSSTDVDQTTNQIVIQTTDNGSAESVGDSEITPIEPSSTTAEVSQNTPVTGSVNAVTSETSAETNKKALAATLLEAANGLQLSYQDKMGARDEYNQELLQSIDALFIVPNAEKSK